LGDITEFIQNIINAADSNNSQLGVAEGYPYSYEDLKLQYYIATFVLVNFLACCSFPETSSAESFFFSWMLYTYTNTSDQQRRSQWKKKSQIIC